MTHPNDRLRRYALKERVVARRNAQLGATEFARAAGLDVPAERVADELHSVANA